jgi:ribosomal protein S18 acetylase RimI-like enzyme
VREAEAMSGGKLAVRAMADGEAAAVIALWQACGLTRPWNDPETDLAFARAKPNSDILVGIIDGRIVASVMVGHDGHRGTMYYVSVDPAWRGRGLGAELVTAAEAWLRARGVWKVNLLVRAGNEQVLGFYAAQGYATGTSMPLEKWIDPSKRGDKG